MHLGHKRFGDGPSTPEHRSNTTITSKHNYYSRLWHNNKKSPTHIFKLWIGKSTVPIDTPRERRLVVLSVPLLVHHRSVNEHVCMYDTHIIYYIEIINSKKWAPGDWWTPDREERAAGAGRSTPYIYIYIYITFSLWKNSPPGGGGGALYFYFFRIIMKKEKSPHPRHAISPRGKISNLFLVGSPRDFCQIYLLCYAIDYFSCDWLWCHYYCRWKAPALLLEANKKKFGTFYAEGVESVCAVREAAS